MFCVAVMEMGLIEMPESGRMTPAPSSAQNWMSLPAASDPSSNSTPAYRSSEFSRTMVRSTSSYRPPAPGSETTGRRHTYKSSVLRSATFTLRKPVPTGVVHGPLMATLLRLTASTVSSGNGVPVFSAHAAPASATSHAMSAPAASTTRCIAADVSRPIPSPGISVTVCCAIATPSSSHIRASESRPLLAFELTPADVCGRFETNRLRRKAVQPEVSKVIFLARCQ